MPRKMNYFELLGLRRQLQAPPSATRYATIAFPKRSVVKKARDVFWKPPRVTSRRQSMRQLDLRESVLRDCRELRGQIKAESAKQDQQRSAQATPEQLLWESESKQEMNAAMLKHQTAVKDLRTSQDSAPVAKLPALDNRSRDEKTSKQVATNTVARSASSAEAADQITTWCARLEASVQHHRGGRLVVQESQRFHQLAAMAPVATARSQTRRIGSPYMSVETKAVRANLVLPCPPNAAQTPPDAAAATVVRDSLLPPALRALTPKTSNIVETLVARRFSMPLSSATSTRIPFSDPLTQREVALLLEHPLTSIQPSTTPAPRRTTASQSNQETITKARLQAALYFSGR